LRHATTRWSRYADQAKGRRPGIDVSVAREGSHRARDREGSFEPPIIGKHERRFTGFDQKIVAMYARDLDESKGRGSGAAPGRAATVAAAQAATKLLWLALRNVISNSARPTREWTSAMNQSAILYGERFACCLGRSLPSNHLAGGPALPMHTDRWPPRSLQ